MRLSDFLRRAFGRDRAEAQEYSRQEILDWFREQGTSFSSCPNRTRCRVAGRVAQTETTPPGVPKQFTARLVDGDSNELDLVWLGQIKMAGVEPEALVIAEGTVQERKGRRTIVDPVYTVVSEGDV